MRQTITLLTLTICFVNFSITTYGQDETSQGQSSIIVSSEGVACMEGSKLRSDVQDEALSLAKENAIKLAASHVKESVQTGHDSTIKKLEDTYARGKVKILSQIGSWFPASRSTECYRLNIRAEILPDFGKTRSWSDQDSLVENPNAPLSVRLWLEKHEFHTNEEIRMFVKGNKDFYALITHKTASGDLLQLFPNSYRSDNYLKGGVVYQIPSKNDKFNLIVNAPFGEETIILHAATMPLGDLEITPAGAFYHVRTSSSEVEIKVRGGVGMIGEDPTMLKPVQFSTNRVILWTRE